MFTMIQNIEWNGTKLEARLANIRMECPITPGAISVGTVTEAASELGACFVKNRVGEEQKLAQGRADIYFVKTAMMTDDVLLSAEFIKKYSSLWEIKVEMFVKGVICARGFVKFVERP